MAHWEEETGGEGMADNYQKFYDCCRNSSTSPNPSNNFPYTISLGTNLAGRELLPFHSGDTLKGQVLVTKSYDELFHHILGFRRIDMGRTSGVVITGQPGTGAPL